MAASKLKPCDTCGHSISTDTKTCPSCGAKNKKKVGKIGLSIAALFLIFAIIGINDQQEAEQAAAAEAKKAAALFAQENHDVLHKSAAANLCLEGIKQKLREPESMKVEEFIGHDYQPATEGRPTTILTGYFIRSKNGFGGYVTDQYLCTTEIVADQAQLIEVVSPK